MTAILYINSVSPVVLINIFCNSYVGPPTSPHISLLYQLEGRRSHHVCSIHDATTHTMILNNQPYRIDLAHTMILNNQPYRIDLADVRIYTI